MEMNVFSREENYATEACGWHETKSPLQVVCGRMQLANFRVFCKTAEVPCAWSNKYLICTVVAGEGSLYWFIINHSEMRLLCCNTTLGKDKIILCYFVFFFKDDTFASWLSPELSITWFINKTCTILFAIYIYMRNNLALANEAHVMIL